jgi:hypothetical protein
MKYVEGYIQGYNMREREEMRDEINEENLDSIDHGIVFLQNVIPGEVEEKDENTLWRLVTEYNVPIAEAVASVIGNIHRNQLSPVATIKTSPSMIPASRDEEEDPFHEPVSYESQRPARPPVSESAETDTEPQTGSDESKNRETLTVDFEDENTEDE